MSLNQRNKKIIRELLRGKSLRQIADLVGVHNKTVYRVGAAQGVYSTRSTRTTTGNLNTKGRTK